MERKDGNKSKIKTGSDAKAKPESLVCFIKSPKIRRKAGVKPQYNYDEPGSYVDEPPRKTAVRFNLREQTRYITEPIGDEVDNIVSLAEGEDFDDWESQSTDGGEGITAWRSPSTNRCERNTDQTPKFDEIAQHSLYSGDKLKEKTEIDNPQNTFLKADMKQQIQEVKDKSEQHQVQQRNQLQVNKTNVNRDSQTLHMVQDTEVHPLGNPVKSEQDSEVLPFEYPVKSKTVAAKANVLQKLSTKDPVIVADVIAHRLSHSLSHSSDESLTTLSEGQDNVFDLDTDCKLPDNLQTHSQSSYLGEYNTTAIKDKCDSNSSKVWQKSAPDNNVTVTDNPVPYVTNVKDDHFDLQANNQVITQRSEKRDQNIFTVDNTTDFITGSDKWTPDLTKIAAESRHNISKIAAERGNNHDKAVLNDANNDVDLDSNKAGDITHDECNPQWIGKLPGFVDSFSSVGATNNNEEQKLDGINQHGSLRCLLQLEARTDRNVSGKRLVYADTNQTAERNLENTAQGRNSESLQTTGLNSGERFRSWEAKEDFNVSNANNKRGKLDSSEEKVNIERLNFSENKHVGKGGSSSEKESFQSLDSKCGYASKRLTTNSQGRLKVSQACSDKTTKRSDHKIYSSVDEKKKSQSSSLFSNRDSRSELVPGIPTRCQVSTDKGKTSRQETTLETNIQEAGDVNKQDLSTELPDYQEKQRNREELTDYSEKERNVEDYYKATLDYEQVYDPLSNSEVSLDVLDKKTKSADYKRIRDSKVTIQGTKENTVYKNQSSRQITSNLNTGTNITQGNINSSNTSPNSAIVVDISISKEVDCTSEDSSTPISDSVLASHTEEKHYSCQDKISALILDTNTGLDKKDSHKQDRTVPCTQTYVCSDYNNRRHLIQEGGNTHREVGPVGVHKQISTLDYNSKGVHKEISTEENNCIGVHKEINTVDNNQLNTVFYNSTGLHKEISTINDNNDTEVHKEISTVNDNNSTGVHKKISTLNDTDDTEVQKEISTLNDNTSINVHKQINTENYTKYSQVHKETTTANEDKITKVHKEISAVDKSCVQYANTTDTTLETDSPQLDGCVQYRYIDPENTQQSNELLVEKGEQLIKTEQNNVEKGENLVKTEQNIVENLVKTVGNKVKKGDNLVKTGQNIVEKGEKIVITEQNKVKKVEKLVKTVGNKGEKGQGRVQTEQVNVDYCDGEKLAATSKQNIQHFSSKQPICEISGADLHESSKSPGDVSLRTKGGYIAASIPKVNSTSSQKRRDILCVRLQPYISVFGKRAGIHSKRYTAKENTEKIGSEREFPSDFVLGKELDLIKDKPRIVLSELKTKVPVLSDTSSSIKCKQVSTPSTLDNKEPQQVPVSIIKPTTESGRNNIKTNRLLEKNEFCATNNIGSVSVCGSSQGNIIHCSDDSNQISNSAIKTEKPRKDHRLYHNKYPDCDTNSNSGSAGIKTGRNLYNDKNLAVSYDISGLAMDPQDKNSASVSSGDDPSTSSGSGGDEEFELIEYSEKNTDNVGFISIENDCVRNKSAAHESTSAASIEDKKCPVISLGGSTSSSNHSDNDDFEILDLEVEPCRLLHNTRGDHLIDQSDPSCNKDQCDLDHGTYKPHYEAMDLDQDNKCGNKYDSMRGISNVNKSSLFISGQDNNQNMELKSNISGEKGDESPVKADRKQQISDLLMAEIPDKSEQSSTTKYDDVVKTDFVEQSSALSGGQIEVIDSRSDSGSCSDSNSCSDSDVLSSDITSAKDIISKAWTSQINVQNFSDKTSNVRNQNVTEIISNDKHKHQSDNRTLDNNPVKSFQSISSNKLHNVDDKPRSPEKPGPSVSDKSDLVVQDTSDDEVSQILSVTKGEGRQGSDDEGRGRSRHRRTVREVKEAMKKLKSGGLKDKDRPHSYHGDVSCDQGVRSRSGSQRRYDWNTTHFFPDIHDPDTVNRSDRSNRYSDYIEESWLQDLNTSPIATTSPVATTSPSVTHSIPVLHETMATRELDKENRPPRKSGEKFGANDSINTNGEGDYAGSSDGEPGSPQMWTKSPLHTNRKKRKERSQEANATPLVIPIKRMGLKLGSPGIQRDRPTPPHMGTRVTPRKYASSQGSDDIQEKYDKFAELQQRRRALESTSEDSLVALQYNSVQDSLRRYEKHKHPRHDKTTHAQRQLFPGGEAPQDPSLPPVDPPPPLPSQPPPPTLHQRSGSQGDQYQNDFLLEMKKRLKSVRKSQEDLRYEETKDTRLRHSDIIVNREVKDVSAGDTMSPFKPSDNLNPGKQHNTQHYHTETTGALRHDGKFPEQETKKQIEEEVFVDSHHANHRVIDRSSSCESRNTPTSQVSDGSGSRRLDARSLVLEERRRFQDYKREYVRRMSSKESTSGDEIRDSSPTHKSGLNLHQPPPPPQSGPTQALSVSLHSVFTSSSHDQSHDLLSEERKVPVERPHIPPDDYEYILRKIHHKPQTNTTERVQNPQEVRAPADKQTREAAPPVDDRHQGEYAGSYWLESDSYLEKQKQKLYSRHQATPPTTPTQKYVDVARQFSLNDGKQDQRNKLHSRSVPSMDGGHYDRHTRGLYEGDNRGSDFPDPPPSQHTGYHENTRPETGYYDNQPVYDADGRIYDYPHRNQANYDNVSNHRAPSQHPLVASLPDFRDRRDVLKSWSESHIDLQQRQKEQFDHRPEKYKHQATDRFTAEQTHPMYHSDPKGRDYFSVEAKRKPRTEPQDHKERPLGEHKQLRSYVPSDHIGRSYDNAKSNYDNIRPDNARPSYDQSRPPYDNVRPYHDDIRPSSVNERRPYDQPRSPYVNLDYPAEQRPPIPRAENVPREPKYWQQNTMYESTSPTQLSPRGLSQSPPSTTYSQPPSAPVNQSSYAPRPGYGSLDNLQPIRNQPQRTLPLDSSHRYGYSLPRNIDPRKRDTYNYQPEFYRPGVQEGAYPASTDSLQKIPDAKRVDPPSKSSHSTDPSKYSHGKLPSYTRMAISQQDLSPRPSSTDSHDASFDQHSERSFQLAYRPKKPPRTHEAGLPSDRDRYIREYIPEPDKYFQPIPANQQPEYMALNEQPRYQSANQMPQHMMPTSQHLQTNQKPHNITTNQIPLQVSANQQPQYKSTHQQPVSSHNQPHLPANPLGYPQPDKQMPPYVTDTCQQGHVPDLIHTPENTQNASPYSQYNIEPIRSGDTYSHVPIKTENTYAQQPISGTSTYLQQPVRREDTYAHQPIRDTDTYSQKPITAADRYPDPIRDDNRYFQPMREEGSPSQQPMRTGKTHSHQPIRGIDAYSQQPMRREDIYSQRPMTVGDTYSNPMTGADTYSQPMTGADKYSQPMTGGGTYSQPMTGADTYSQVYPPPDDQLFEFPQQDQEKFTQQLSEKLQQLEQTDPRFREYEEKMKRYKDRSNPANEKESYKLANERESFKPANERESYMQHKQSEATNQYEAYIQDSRDKFKADHGWMERRKDDKEYVDLRVIRQRKEVFEDIRQRQLLRSRSLPRDPRARRDPSPPSGPIPGGGRRSRRADPPSNEATERVEPTAFERKVKTTQSFRYSPERRYSPPKDAQTAGGVHKPRRFEVPIQIPQSRYVLRPSRSAENLNKMSEDLPSVSIQDIKERLFGPGVGSRVAVPTSKQELVHQPKVECMKDKFNMPIQSVPNYAGVYKSVNSLDTTDKDELLYNYASYRETPTKKKLNIFDDLTDLEVTYERVTTDELPPGGDPLEPSVKRLSISNVRKFEELLERKMEEDRTKQWLKQEKTQAQMSSAPSGQYPVLSLTKTSQHQQSASLSPTETTSGVTHVTNEGPRSYARSSLPLKKADDMAYRKTHQMSLQSGSLPLFTNTGSYLGNSSPNVTPSQSVDNVPIKSHRRSQSPDPIDEKLGYRGFQRVDANITSSVATEDWRGRTTEARRHRLRSLPDRFYESSDSRPVGHVTNSQPADHVTDIQPARHVTVTVRTRSQSLERQKAEMDTKLRRTNSFGKDDKPVSRGIASMVKLFSSPQEVSQSAPDLSKVGTVFSDQYTRDGDPRHKVNPRTTPRDVKLRSEIKSKMKCLKLSGDSGFCPESESDSEQFPRLPPDGASCDHGDRIGKKSSSSSPDHRVKSKTHVINVNVNNNNSYSRNVSSTPPSSSRNASKTPPSPTIKTEMTVQLTPPAMRRTMATEGSPLATDHVTLVGRSEEVQKSSPAVRPSSIDFNRMKRKQFFQELTMKSPSQQSTHKSPVHGVTHKSPVTTPRKGDTFAAQMSQLKYIDDVIESSVVKATHTPTCEVVNISPDSPPTRSRDSPPTDNRKPRIQLNRDMLRRRDSSLDLAVELVKPKPYPFSTTQLETEAQRTEPASVTKPESIQNLSPGQLRTPPSDDIGSQLDRDLQVARRRLTAKLTPRVTRPHSDIITSHHGDHTQEVTSPAVTSHLPRYSWSESKTKTSVQPLPSGEESLNQNRVNEGFTELRDGYKREVKREKVHIVHRRVQIQREPVYPGAEWKNIAKVEPTMHLPMSPTMHLQVPMSPTGPELSDGEMTDATDITLDSMVRANLRPSSHEAAVPAHNSDSDSTTSENSQREYIISEGVKRRPKVVKVVRPVSHHEPSQSQPVLQVVTPISQSKQSEHIVSRVVTEQSSSQSQTITQTSQSEGGTVEEETRSSQSQYKRETKKEMRDERRLSLKERVQLFEEQASPFLKGPRVNEGNL